jgi:hypothetical protein
LSGRGLHDVLITHPEESYLPWCVVECDLETSGIKKAIALVGPQRHVGAEVGRIPGRP